MSLAPLSRDVQAVILKTLAAVDIQTLSDDRAKWKMWKFRLEAALQVAGVDLTQFLLSPKFVKDAHGSIALHASIAAAIVSLLVRHLPDRLSEIASTLPPWNTRDANCNVSGEPFSDDDKSPAQPLMRMPHPSAIWTELLNFYEPVNTARAASLFEQFTKLKMDSDFRSFVAQIESLASELSVLRNPVSDTHKLSILLQGLPGHAQPVKTAIQIEKSCSFRTAVDRLSEYFTTLSFSDSPSPSSTPSSLPSQSVAAMPLDVSRVCNHCQRPGHTEAQCFRLHPELRGASRGRGARGRGRGGSARGRGGRSSGQPSRFGPKEYTDGAICGFCKNKGHTTEQCQKKKRHDQSADQPASNSASASSASSLSLTAMPVDVSAAAPASGSASAVASTSSPLSPSTTTPADASASPLFPSETIIDSGAMMHLFRDRHLFVSMSPLAQPFSLTGYQSASPVEKVTHGGTVQLTVVVNGRARQQLINNVGYAPGASRNLISTPCLLLRGFRCAAKPAVGATPPTWTCFRGRTPLLQATVLGQHLVLNMDYGPRLFSSLVSSSACDVSLFRWHERLGHMSLPYVKRCLQLAKLDVPDATAAELDQFAACVPCKAAKMQQHPHPPHDANRATAPLTRLHIDIVGPLVDSVGGNRFAVVFTDDFSRAVDCEPLKHKSDLAAKFVAFVTYWQQRLQLRLGFIRLDNAGEHRALLPYCTANGIKLEFTVPYTPQQNGVAERSNRRIITLCRALFERSAVPVRFWPYAFKFACRVLNNVPCSSNDGVAPTTRWAGGAPQLTMLKTFGCAAYAHDKNASKLGPQMIKSVHLGVDPDRKAWLLWDLDDKRVFPAFDVEFNEALFPFASPSSTAPPSSAAHRVPDLELTDFLLPAAPAPAAAAAAPPLAVGPVPVPASAPPAAVPPADRAPAPVAQPVAPAHQPAAAPPAAAPPAAAQPVPAPPAPAPPAPALPPRHSGRDNLGVPAYDPYHVYIHATRALADLAPLNLRGTLDDEPEPATYEAAVNGQHAPQWLASMSRELARLTQLGTFQYVERSSIGDKSPIGTKWVFKYKRDSNGNITDFKSRLVAKGYQQVPGVDFVDVSSPVAQHTSLRLLLAISAHLGLTIKQFDIKSAFVNAPLAEEVYVEQPDGFADGTDRVIRLRKALYGLRQAGRAWNETVNVTLARAGLSPLVSDPCVYVKFNDDDRSLAALLVLYVDDMLLAYAAEPTCAAFTAVLKSDYDVDERGIASWMLGMRIQQLPDRITVDQQQYIKDVLANNGMYECKNRATPADAVESVPDTSAPADRHRYRSIVGSLQYAANCTRPDLSFAASTAGRHLSSPTERDLKMVTHTLQYLHGHASIGLSYCRSPRSLPQRPLTVTGFCDASFASDLSTRKSTTGIVFFACGAPVSWVSKQQSFVVLSTAEAELVALSAAAQEACFLHNFLLELRLLDTAVPITISSDSLSAKAIAENPIRRSRVKSLDLRDYFVRQCINRGIIRLAYCPTDEMVADALTKALNKQPFEHHRAKLLSECSLSA